MSEMVVASAVVILAVVILWVLSAGTKSAMGTRIKCIAGQSRTRAAAVLALAVGLLIACVAAYNNPVHYVSREVMRSIEIGCRSERPGERAAWEKLRDEFLPAYREAVDACEDGPIVLEMAEVERRLLGHARGNAYYEYIWRLRTKEKLFIYAIEALGDIQRDGTQEGLRSDVVAVERVGPDGKAVKTDQEHYYRHRNRDGSEVSWTGCECSLPGGDFLAAARALMDEIGERHLKAAGHNSAAATAYEIRSVRICDTVPGDPNHFVFRGSFRFTPVDSENFHWISDYAETVFNNDGTLDFAAEFAVERGENGIWRITDMGSWVAADEYGKSGWYRDQGEIDFMSFQTSAAGPEAIAREFLAQYTARLRQAYERGNLCGAQTVEITNIYQRAFDEETLIRQGRLPETYTDAFYVTARADVTLPAQPMKWRHYWSLGMGTTLRDGRQRFWLGLLFCREGDSWNVEFCPPEWMEPPLMLFGELKSPDGKWEFSVSGTGGDGARFLLTDTATGAVRWGRSGDDAGTALWSPDGRYAAITCTARHFQEVYIFDTTDFSERVVPAAEPPDGIRLRPIDLAATTAIEWTDSRTLRCRTRFQIAGDEHRYPEDQNDGIFEVVL